MLEARELRAELPGDDGPSRILDGVDVVLRSGELVDLTGPSGSGKTTLLRALARLLPDTHGTLLLDGRPAEEWPPSEWRATVALLPQKPAMWPGTIRDSLLMPHKLRVRAKGRPPSEGDMRAALEDVGLGELSLDRDTSRLSLGQAARVALLRVTLTSPRVLLLDEPDASLDDASAEQVRFATERFVSDGGAVLRVRHARVDAGASRRVRLEDGRLIEMTVTTAAGGVPGAAS